MYIFFIFRCCFKVGHNYILEENENTIDQSAFYQSIDSVMLSSAKEKFVQKKSSL